MISLHDHAPSATPSTSVLATTQPPLVHFPWLRQHSFNHTLWLLPCCFSLESSFWKESSLLFLSSITRVIWLLGFRCCGPLIVCDTTFTCPPAFVLFLCPLLGWEGSPWASHPRWNPAFILDLSPTPISHWWILRVKHWSGSLLSISLPTKPF